MSEAMPKHAGKLLSIEAMRQRIADRLEGGRVPSLYWIRTKLPPSLKIRGGKCVYCWEDDFEQWFSTQFGRKSA